MRVLVVCSKNSGFVAPFIAEQVEAVQQLGVEVQIYTIQGKGALGYLKNLKFLKRRIRSFHPDIIHAHYGLSGLLANLQRKVPVITTFHGSDFNDKRIKPFSTCAAILSRHTIFVSKKLAKKAGIKYRYTLLPCGVDTNTFLPIGKSEARKAMNLPHSGKLVLFAGHAANKVKNFPLAKTAIDLLEDVTLLELKGYTRSEVNLLMNACDSALMTSYTEGSPQFIKEAMACNLPIISTDVGDIRETIGETKGCYITSYNPEDIAEKIKLSLAFYGRTTGRERINSSSLTLKHNAGKLIQIYKQVTLNNYRNI